MAFGRTGGEAGVLAYLAHRDSLLALGVLALLLSVLESAGSWPGALSGVGFVLARLGWAIYFFLVVRKAALGSKRLPVPSDHVDTWDTLLQPLIQSAVATAAFWVPLLVFVHLTVGVRDFVERYQAHPLMFLGDHGIVGRVLLGAGLVQVPCALVASILSREILAPLDPLLGFRMVRRVASAYAATFAILSGLGLLGYVIDVAAMRLQAEIPIPLAAPVLSHLVRLWVPLAQARLLGQFIRDNRGRLLEARPSSGGHPPR
jgi:hypothetical protein